MEKEQESEFGNSAGEWGFILFSFGVMTFALTYVFTIDIPFPLEGSVRTISQIAVGMGACSIILGLILAFIISPRIERKKTKEEK